MLRMCILILPAFLAAGHVWAQGLVTFNCTPSTGVFDYTTGLPVAVNRVVAGLYYTTDLSAAPFPYGEEDEFLLAAVTAVSASPIFPGVYSGGTVTIPNVPEGTQVLLQVRAWDVGYDSLEEAIASGDAFCVGWSNAGILTLGGGTTPVPATSSFVEPIWVCVPEPSGLAMGLVAGGGCLAGWLRRRRPMRVAQPSGHSGSYGPDQARAPTAA